MLSYMPTLVLRTRYTPALLEVNGTLLGECLPEENQHLALPLSGNGDYYIAVLPLCDDFHHYYPIMRKLTFRDGVLTPHNSDDLDIYAWPGGIYEVVLSPGILPRELSGDFPYTVDQLSLGDGCTATLYYEGGMRLAVEQGMRLRYGAVLGPGQTGRLLPWKQGGFAALSEGEPQTLLVLSGSYEELLRLSADQIQWEDGEAVCIERMSTLMRHEVRRIFRYDAGKSETFLEQPPQTGFFTHEPTAPLPGRPLLCAFCEAVREGFYEEALSYMSPSLTADLSPAEVKSFFGDFIACRPPLSEPERLMGLVYPPENGVYPLRVFEFSMIDGKIDDVSEG